MSFPDIQRLGREIEVSDPRDPVQQSRIHERLVRLRDELDRAQATDLAAYLDSAAQLTDYLIHMGRMGPEDVLDIVNRLVRKVEQLFDLQRDDEDEDEEAGPTAIPASVTRALEAELSAATEEKLLGEVMVQLGFITQAQLDKGLVTQRATDQRIGEALVSTGAVTWDQVREAVAVQERLRSALPLDGSPPSARPRRGIA